MEYLQELEDANTFDEVLHIFHQAIASGQGDKVITQAEEALLRIEKQKAVSHHNLSIAMY